MAIAKEEKERRKGKCQTKTRVIWLVNELMRSTEGIHTFAAKTIPITIGPACSVSLAYV